MNVIVKVNNSDELKEVIDYLKEIKYEDEAILNNKNYIKPNNHYIRIGYYCTFNHKVGTSAIDDYYMFPTITFNEFKNKYIMNNNTKEIKIEIPEGYEIDKSLSTFEKIVFKKKTITYKDIQKELFYKKNFYYINNNGLILSHDSIDGWEIDNNCTSRKQAEKLLAINKLMNVTKYLNNNWKPNFDNTDQEKFEFRIINKDLIIDRCYSYNISLVYFKTRELAKQALNILGENTIRLALSTNW